MTDKKQGGKDLKGIPPIDKIIHEPARLVIVAHLYVVESADFLFLKRQTGMTWGNLSSHISKLEDSGYVEVEKGFVGKKPNTRVHLTDKGQATFEEYRRNMKRVFDETPSRSQSDGGETRGTGSLNLEAFRDAGSWETSSTSRVDLPDLKSLWMSLMWLLGILFLAFRKREVIGTRYGE